MLYPKQPLASLLESKSNLLKEIWKALSGITAEILIRRGRVYGGGLYKVEPKELGSIPADTVLEVLSGETEFKMERQLQLFGG